MSTGCSLWLPVKCKTGCAAAAAENKAPITTKIEPRTLRTGCPPACEDFNKSNSVYGIASGVRTWWVKAGAGVEVRVVARRQRRDVRHLPGEHRHRQLVVDFEGLEEERRSMRRRLA